MAEDVLDKVLGDGHPKCNTLDTVLHGGEGYTERLSVVLIQKYGVLEDVAEVCRGMHFCVVELRVLPSLTTIHFLASRENLRWTCLGSPREGSSDRKSVAEAWHPARSALSLHRGGGAVCMLRIRVHN